MSCIVKILNLYIQTGWRLLHQAADEGHIKMVHKLINAGADVNIAENVIGLIEQFFLELISFTWHRMEAHRFIAHHIVDI